jgi:hypothetical protein
LEENLGALDVELSPGDLLAIENVVSKITIQGDRYPEQHERLTGR